MELNSGNHVPMMPRQLGLLILSTYRHFIWWNRNIPAGETTIWAAARLLIVAQAPPVALEVLVTDVVDAAMQLQALEILNVWFPSRSCVQASAAYVGMAVAATELCVKVAQNDWAAWRRPGVWVALIARRQLSALHAPETKVAKRRVVKAYNIVTLQEI